MQMLPNRQMDSRKMTPHDYKYAIKFGCFSIVMLTLGAIIQRILSIIFPNVF